MPRFSGNVDENQSNGYYRGEFVENESQDIFNERSDTEILRPEPSSEEFRPHQVKLSSDRLLESYFVEIFFLFLKRTNLVQYRGCKNLSKSILG